MVTKRRFSFRPLTVALGLGAAGVPLLAATVAFAQTLFSATGVVDHRTGTTGTCLDGGMAFSVASAPFVPSDSSPTPKHFVLTATPTPQDDAGVQPLAKQISTTVTSVSGGGTTIGLATSCASIPSPFRWDIGTDNSANLATCLTNANCRVDTPSDYMFLSPVTLPGGRTLSCVSGATLSFPPNDNSGGFLQLVNSNDLVSGCTFVGSNLTAYFQPSTDYFVSISGSSQNTVFGNTIKNGWSMGDINITGDAPNGFGNPPCSANWPTLNGVASLTDFYPSSLPTNNLIASNTITNCGFNGIAMETGNGNVIENNSLLDCNFDIEPTDACLGGPVFNNLVYGNSIAVNPSIRDSNLNDPGANPVWLSGNPLVASPSNAGAGQETISFVQNSFSGRISLYTYCAGADRGGPLGQPWIGNQAFYLNGQNCPLGAGGCATNLYSFTCASNPSMASANNLHRLTFNGSSWTDTNLMVGGHPTASPSSAVSGVFDYADFTYYVVPTTVTAGHIYQTYKWNGSQVYTDLTAQAGAPAAQSCAGETVYLDQATGARVAYVAIDQHVHQLYQSNTPTGWQWMDEDVTAVTGDFAPIACSALSSYVDGAGLPHIWFIGVDQLLHESFMNQYGWDAAYFPASPPAVNTPAVGTGLTAYITSSGEEHIFYVGTDQYVHQWSFAGSDWMTQNFELGGATGSGLSSVINGSQQYVFFVDKNEDVKELYFNGTSWSAFDFTAQTNGAANALAGSGLSASFNENGDPTTVYVGSDSNVHRASGTSSHWYTDQRTTSGTVSNGSGLTALFSGYQDIYYLSTN